MDYDQWKTASPYDGDDDEHCAYCGKELPDDVTNYSVRDDNAVEDGYCNVKCLELGSDGSISPRYGLPEITDNQRGQILALMVGLNEVRDTTPKPYDLKSFMEHVPDGDFKWNGEAGDDHVYCCGEKDCDRQWHLVAYYENISRNNGVLTIDGYSVDEDGNHELDFAWKEGDDFTEVAWAMGQGRLNEYFRGWAQYWIDAAETGTDPCALATEKPLFHENWTQFCIDAARDNIKYFDMNNNI
jgi:hypothetical protein